MCTKLLYLTASILCFVSVYYPADASGVTFRRPWMTMAKAGFYTTKTPRHVISWTPGLEVNRMVLNGSEIVFRVVNGVEADPGDVPYQISFRKQLKRANIFASFCGGTLITPGEAISAAHCFHQKGFCDSICPISGKIDLKQLQTYYALAGIVKTFSRGPIPTDDTGPQWRTMRNVYYSKQYSFPDHDFAVVFFHQPFTINTLVAPLPYAKKTIDYKGSCLLSGFGRISDYKMSNNLRLAELRVLSKSQCNYIHRKDMHNFLCTSDEVSDIGLGDSGGPLVCKNTGDPNEGPRGILVGIVCGKHRRYRSGSFFVRMSEYTHVLAEARYRNENACNRTQLSVLVFWFCLVAWLLAL